MGTQNKKTITKTRNRTRDIDQIKEDLLSPKHLAQHTEAQPAEDLPALGQHYCIECAKWFDSESNLVVHRRGKPHKRRVKQVLEPYTHKEADAAGGLWTGYVPGRQQDQEVEMEMS